MCLNAVPEMRQGKLPTIPTIDKVVVLMCVMCATGATVIATCSSEDKAAMLRTLGADRVINYKYECVGGGACFDRMCNFLLVL